MSTQDKVKEILEMVTPGTTLIRKYPKEVLVEAICEMKLLYSNQAIKMKEYELQMKILDREIELKRIDAEMTISKQLIDHSEMMKDHKYGPKAIGDVSSSIASIWSGPQAKKSAEESLSDDLEERVERAVKQGLQWNSSNKRPSLTSTVLRKLEAWEKAVELGRESDPDDFSSKSYEEILASNGGSEGFIVGLCETMEKRLGIGPSSKYLKTRFKRDMKKLYGSVTVEETPPPDYEQQAAGLVEKFWGDSISDADKADIKAKLTDRIEKAEGVQNLTVRGLKTLCNMNRLPVAIDFPESQSDNERNKALCWGEKHDGEVEEVIRSYAKSLVLS